MPTQNAVGRSRTPRGGNAKPIQLTLRKNERAAVEQLAEIEQRSLAATVRILVIRALEQAPWPSGASAALLSPQSPNSGGPHE